MRRASYRNAIDWIANNDGAGDCDRLELEAVSYLVSSVLIADIFGVECERVGADIIRKRKQLIKAGDL